MNKPHSAQTDNDMLTGTTSNGTWYEYRKGQGPVVVLVHGLGLNHTQWQWQVAAISASFPLLTYDLTGSGKSAPPVTPPSLATFSKQLLSLLHELQISQVIVAGFSLGGMIARRFAMDYPERLRALAILNSAHKRDPAAHAAIQQRVYQAQTDGPAATVDAALDRWFTRSYREANPQVMQYVRDAVLGNGKSVYPLIYQVLVDGVDELIKPTPAITCPTLVLTAEEDYGNSVAMTHAIAAEIPNAKTVILPGLRHMAMVEAPDLFNAELMAFLNSVTES